MIILMLVSVSAYPHLKIDLANHTRLNLIVILEVHGEGVRVELDPYSDRPNSPVFQQIETREDSSIYEINYTYDSSNPAWSNWSSLTVDTPTHDRTFTYSINVLEDYYGDGDFRQIYQSDPIEVLPRGGNIISDIYMFNLHYLPGDSRFDTGSKTLHHSRIISKKHSGEQISTVANNYPYTFTE